MEAREYIEQDAIGLADLIRRKEISAREACEAALTVHIASDSQISATIEIWPDEIDDAIAAAPQESPFRGVPFMVKDMVLTMKGKKTESGSRLAEGLIAPDDTELMRRFRAAGLITLARTKTPELGSSSSTEPVMHGAVHNPWNLIHSAGGSSGGSAAVVAARVVPVAHANDGSGSIRIPSASCGTVGLKPTRGRVSAGPNHDEILSGFGVEFVITRSLRDCAAMLDAVHGPAIGEAYEIVPPFAAYSEIVRRFPGQLKIGLMLHPHNGEKSNPNVVQAVERVARVCADLGHIIEIAAPELGMSWDAFVDMNAVLECAGLAAWVEGLAAATGRKPGETNLEQHNLAAYHYGRQLSASDMLGALSARNTFTRRFAAFFATYDLLLSPTLPEPPLPLGIFSNWQGDGRSWIASVFAHTPFTPVFNVSGLPAISLPLAHDDGADLPLGVQFGAAFGREDILLQLAAQLEATLPWAGRKPAICQKL